MAQAALRHLRERDIVAPTPWAPYSTVRRIWSARRPAPDPRGRTCVGCGLQPDAGPGRLQSLRVPIDLEVRHDNDEYDRNDGDRCPRSAVL